MKTITTNNRTLLFVEVPEDAQFLRVLHDGYGHATLFYHISEAGGFTKFLPDGEYEFIATTDKIDLVDKIDILGGGVFHSNSDWDRYFQTFLDTHSITGRHAIIEVL